MMRRSWADAPLPERQRSDEQAMEREQKVVPHPEERMALRIMRQSSPAPLPFFFSDP
jgi:hypothetical protein